MTKFTFEEKCTQAYKCSERISKIDNEFWDFIKSQAIEISEFCANSYQNYLTNNNISENDIRVFRYMRLPYFEGKNVTIFDFPSARLLESELSSITTPLERLSDLIDKMSETKAYLFLSTCHIKIVEYKIELIVAKDIHDQYSKAIWDECGQIIMDCAVSLALSDKPLTDYSHSIQCDDIEKLDPGNWHDCIFFTFSNLMNTLMLQDSIP